MKTIVVSVRLTPQHLAKAMDGLTAYDPSSVPGTLSEIVKATFYHGINTLSADLPIMPSAQSLDMIHNLTRQGKKSFKPENILATTTPETTLTPDDQAKVDNLRANIGGDISRLTALLSHSDPEIVRIAKILYEETNNG